MTYTVIYEKGPTSWGAYVPDLSGVIAVGDSREEVERLIQEASSVLGQKFCTMNCWFAHGTIRAPM